jgi:hypothetical protein
VLRGAGALRVCWPVALAFVRPGTAGLILVIGVEFVLITCIGVFNPVLATYRLEQTDSSRVARVLSAWSVSTSATIAALTALWACWPASPARAPRSRSPGCSCWRPRCCYPAGEEAPSCRSIVCLGPVNQRLAETCQPIHSASSVPSTTIGE